jgi:hypothetical protein
MLKDVGIIAVCDLVVFIVLSGFLIKRAEEVKACSGQLFGVGIAFLSYQATFVIREIATMIGCYFTMKPDSAAVQARFAFSFVDWIGVSAIVIWSTIVISSKETEACRVSSSDVQAWWYICVICLVFGYIYMVVLCCCWDLLAPVICCLICIAFVHGSQHAH